MTKGEVFSILLVDDDSEDREMIDEAFVEIGNARDIKKFITGKDLLAYLQKLDPALFPTLIVLDNTMPELGAPDLLYILKHDEKFRSIPVVVYSSHCSPSETAALKAQGAYECMEKADSVRSILAMAHHLRQLAGVKKATDMPSK